MAHLVAENDWEVKNPVLDSAFRRPPARRFACVEVELNEPLWHLDLRFTLSGGVSHWRRFIFSALDQVAATVEAHRGECRLHLQSTQQDEQQPYHLWPVHCLRVAEDCTGRAFHVVELEHVKLTYPELHDRELVQGRMIYGEEAAQ